MDPFDFHCANCKAHLQLALAVGFSKRKRPDPQPGDVMMCSYCLGVLVWGNEGWHLASEAEQMRAAHVLEPTRRLLEAMRRARGVPKTPIM